MLGVNLIIHDLRWVKFNTLFKPKLAWTYIILNNRTKLQIKSNHVGKFHLNQGWDLINQIDSCNKILNSAMDERPIQYIVLRSLMKWKRLINKSFMGHWAPVNSLNAYFCYATDQKQL